MGRARRERGARAWARALALALFFGVARGALVVPYTPPTATAAGSVSAGSRYVAMKIGQTYMFEVWQTNSSNPHGAYKRWYKTSDEVWIDAHLSGNRSTLFVIEFSSGAVTNPELVFTNDEVGSQWTHPLNDPLALPTTYGGDDPMARPYSTTAYSVVLDARYVSKGLSVIVKTDEGNSANTSIRVGPVITMKTLSVPMFMFGAHESMTDDDGNVVTRYSHGWMGEEKAQEHWTKYPFANFINKLHPIQLIQSDYWIIKPRTSKTGLKKPAFRAYYRDDMRRRIRSDYSVDSTSALDESYKDGFADEASGIAFTELLHEVDGEIEMSTHYYASLIFRDESGVYQTGGAGLGGGHHGAGTPSFSGVFYHEQGHAFGLGHAESDYEKGDYPYVGGSLKGSDWGYDVLRNKFIDVFIHTDAETFEGDNTRCTTSDHQTGSDDGKTKCYKQSVMQSGNHDQEPGMYFGQMADYNVAEILEHIEGSMASGTTNPNDPLIVKEGGRVFHDECTCGNHAYYNYRKWNNTAQEFFPVTPTWTFPHYFETPLVLVWATISCAELRCYRSADLLRTKSNQVLTQVYKPTTYVGNSRLVVNPDNFEVLKTIYPAEANARYKDFCGRGCDFMAYVTLAGGSLRKAVFPRSLRNDDGDVDFPSESRDETHPKSFDNFGLAVPTGGMEVERIDIMYTPLAWKGVHNRIPQVIASWSAANGEEYPGAPPVLNSHLMTYDFKFTLPQPQSICDMQQVSLEFAIAIERAVMDTLACDEKLALPSFSNTNLKCVCMGEACQDGCSWTRPSPKYDDPNAAATPAYDKTSDTCSGGTVHISSLTPSVSGGLTRYQDSSGNQYKLVNPGLATASNPSFLGATGLATDACSALGPSAGLAPLETCYGFIYRSGGFKDFLTGQCMEPCMEQTVPAKYEAFYSLGGTARWPFVSTPESYSSIHFRVEIEVMDAFVAGQAFFKLADTATISKIASKIVGDSYVQSEWSGIAANQFSVAGTGAVQSSHSFAAPLVYPSAATVCYGFSEWQEPPSPLSTPSCVTDCSVSPPPPGGSSPVPSPPPGGPSPVPSPSPGGPSPVPSPSPGGPSPVPSPPPGGSSPVPSPPPDLPPGAVIPRPPPPGASPRPPLGAASPPPSPPPAPDATAQVIQVTMVLQGYTVASFDDAARRNFKRGVAAATRSTRITEDDIYLISVAPASDNSRTRKLLQYTTTASVPKLAVEYEILAESATEAATISSNLEAPITVDLLRSAGLSNLAGVETETAYVAGSTYTRKSQVEEDLEEFGFGLISVAAFILLTLAAIYFFGLLRPTSYVALLLVRIKGEQGYHRAREFWCCCVVGEQKPSTFAPAPAPVLVAPVPPRRLPWQRQR